MSQSCSVSSRCSNDYCSDRSTCSSSSSSSGTLKKSRSLISQSLPSLESALCDLADIDEDISATKPNPMYKTSHQLIKEKLERIKAQMEKTSVDHLRRRPERKPYHPFVWNSLSPYRDTYEIDYLIAMSSSHDLHSMQRDATLTIQKS